LHFQKDDKNGAGCAAIGNAKAGGLSATGNFTFTYG